MAIVGIDTPTKGKRAQPITLCYLVRGLKARATRCHLAKVRVAGTDPDDLDFDSEYEESYCFTTARGETDGS